MKYHKFRLKKTIKKTINHNWHTLLCQFFGHRINNNLKHHWCERCGLAYQECYYPEKYY